MRDRIATMWPIAAFAGMLGLCCGLPILLSLGVAGAIAGWSLQSWALMGLGLVLAALGYARISRGRRHDKSCHRPEATVPGAAATAHTTDSTTDASATKKESPL
ncbi:hypothetical protein GCM10027596_25290 [Nocardioides korecus]